MGYLLSQGERYQFEDRTLAHLQVVVINKLRHDEALALFWTAGLSEGHSQMSLWLHPTTDLRFHLYGSRVPMLNKDRLALQVACATQRWTLERRSSSSTASSRRPSNASVKFDTSTPGELDGSDPIGGPPIDSAN
jgi:hypothetical protein